MVRIQAENSSLKCGFFLNLMCLWDVMNMIIFSKHNHLKNIIQTGQNKEIEILYYPVRAHNCSLKKKNLAKIITAHPLKSSRTNSFKKIVYTAKSFQLYIISLWRSCFLVTVTVTEMGYKSILYWFHFTLHSFITYKTLEKGRGSYF